MKYQSSSTHCSKVISKVKDFFKKWVKLQGQGHSVKNNGTHGKVLSQGNALEKYQSSSTHCLKFINKVKVFKIWVKIQGQGHRVKNNGTHGKVLSQRIFM